MDIWTIAIWNTYGYFGPQGHLNNRHLDYLWRLDYCHLDYFGLQGHLNYPRLEY